MNADLANRAELLNDRTPKEMASFVFQDRTIRQGFIRKVFALLSVMLLIVSIMTLIPFIFPSVKHALQSNKVALYVSIGIFTVVSLCITLIVWLRRTMPYNLIAMAVVALSAGYMIMMACSVLDIVAVLMAFGGTTVACSLVALFAIQTRFDLYSKFGGLYVLGSIFVLGGVLFSFTAFAQVPALMCLYAWIGVVVFMLFFAMDIQLVMGGHRYKIDEEEYIFAALTLFLDIIYILFELLKILTAKRENSNGDQ